ncbi:MAG: hypothetical protein KAI17_11960 [Thiotrichaceae bacterium]|nr:hypothetical protein [Thiotrichaceae bacterium]
MKHLSESNVLKRYSQPPDKGEQQENSPIEPFPISPIDMPQDTFQKGIKRRHKNREVLLQWIKENLQSQVDYGQIHFNENCAYAQNGSAELCAEPSHWSKPILWKSGAEKIVGVLGLSVHFPNLNQFEMASAHKQELNQIILKCQLKTHGGTVISEGVGARSIEQDGYNLNKALKMAAKTAVIDATVRASGLSNIFGQNDVQGKSLPTKSSCNWDKVTGKGACTAQIKLITHRQKDFIMKLSGRLGLTIEGLDKRCKSSFKSAFKVLERHHASKLIQQLNEEF